MNKLEELIKEFCPNGVEYKKLGELGQFYGGLSGKSKNDFTDGNEKFITYKNVYSNPALELDIEDRVKINKGEKQNSLQYGDIIFTGSSETPDECGFSSVITKETNEKLYLNSFCFFFRMDDPSLLLPDFAKHLFRADSIRYQIGKTASGVTRYNVSKEKMKQVQIPLPALPVQREIVRVLDSFTLYSAELTAELTARRKQYEFYRDKLLNFNSTKIEWKTLKETCDIVDYRGKTPQKVDKGIFLVTAKNIKKGYIDYETSKEYVAKEDYVEVMRRGIPEIGDVIFTTEAPCGNVAQIDNRNVALAQRVIKYRPKNNKLNSTFLKYYLLSKNFQSVLHTKTTGGTVEGIKGSVLHQLLIPVPPMDVQERIVKVLDNFDAICSDLGIGLPAEIEKRQKQYEYYREKLLTFDGKPESIFRQTDRQG